MEQSLLKEVLHYVPDTGVFTWRVSRGNVKAGSVAKSRNPNGYVEIKIDRRTYKAHRLAWFYMYGNIPNNLQIDHKNGVRNDNRLGNLRLATQVQQSQNVTTRNDNTSGYIGVNWHKHTHKWVARIQVEGKRIAIGYYDTPEEASEAYKKAKQEHHKFNPIQRGAIQ